MAERCDKCTWVETPNTARNSKVKGYICTKLCAEHEAEREASRAKTLERRKQEEAEILISEKSRELAVEALVSEGKIKKTGDSFSLVSDKEKK